MVDYNNLIFQHNEGARLRSELASFKADAIRLLGEKVKAEKERDRAVVLVKGMLHLACTAVRYTGGDSSGEDEAIIFAARELIAEIERG